MASLYRRFMAWSLSRSENSQHRIYGDHKQRLFKPMHRLPAGSRILEIGPGTGINMPYLPSDMRWVGVEPNEAMETYIRDRPNAIRFEVEVIQSGAEEIPLPDDSVDAAISTLVLCSVDDPVQVLSELYRVLRPGGTFYFIEHVAASSGTALRFIQKALRPCWCYLGDGCRLDRETASVIEASPFEKVQIDHFEIGLPLPVKPHIMGRAKKKE